MKNKILVALIIMSNPIMFLSISAFRGNRKSFLILIIIMELCFMGIIWICINEQIKRGFEWVITIPMIYIFAMIFLFPIFLKKQINIK